MYFQSCPVIRVYSAENLDSALDAATRNFCEQEVKVYEIQRELHVSRVFQWYCQDFGQNDVQAIRSVDCNIENSEIPQRVGGPRELGIMPWHFYDK